MATSLLHKAKRLHQIECQLGRLKKEKAEISESVEKHMVGHCKDEIIVGEYRLSLVARVRRIINYKAILKKIKPSKKLLTYHTEEKPYTFIKVHQKGR